MLPPRLLACLLLPQSQRVGAGWQVGECVSLCLPCVPSPGVCGSQPKHKHKYSSFEHIVRLAGVFLFLQCLHCVFWDLCLETIKMYWQPVIFGFWGIWFWSQCLAMFSKLFQEVSLIQCYQTLPGQRMFACLLNKARIPKLTEHFQHKWYWQFGKDI